MERVAVSVVAPFFNEVESALLLHCELVAVLSRLGKPFEIIFVDDGSSDGTFRKIRELSPIRAIRLTRRYGQTAVFACGIAAARGAIVVTMDGDLENRPEDVLRLLAKLAEGYDVVAGTGSFSSRSNT